MVEFITTLELPLCHQSPPPLCTRIGMPICIECRYPVPQLYHVLHSSTHNPSYSSPKVSTHGNAKPTSASAGISAPNVTIPRSKGGGESKSGGIGGGDVRLTQCPRCKRFADKYVEHDFVVLFIDLVLVKPQVSCLTSQSPVPETGLFDVTLWLMSLPMLG